MSINLQKIKRSCWVVCLLLLVLFVKTKANAQEGEEANEFAYEKGGVFEYKVKPGSDEWQNMKSTDERIEACRIPDEILNELTSAELVELVLDFPYVINIYAFSSPLEGVENLEKISDAYAELIVREDAINAIVAKIRQLREDELTVYEEIQVEQLAAMLLLQKQFLLNMEQDILEYVDSVSVQIDIDDYSFSAKQTLEMMNVRSGPSTPKGNPVPYITCTCNHENSNYHALIDADLVATFGVELITVGSCKYNCHSYAWYIQASYNSYWINDPSIYMTDGSYRQILSGINSFSNSVKQNDVVFYGTTTNLISAHSALIYDAPTGAPLVTRYVKSKWGKCGVFKHLILNVPDAYNTSTITVWRKN